MRIIAQILSAILIAAGVGLLVAGGSLAPAEMNIVEQTLTSTSQRSRDIEFVHHLAIAFKGFGACFLTLGILGLAVPWANVLCFGRRLDSAAVYESNSSGTSKGQDAQIRGAHAE